MKAGLLYGLIGSDLSHSFSEKYFHEKFLREGITGVEYRNFPLAAIEELPRFLAAWPDLRGFNVTIPYKESVVPCLSELRGDAAAIGAVNCVAVERAAESDAEVKLTGYNTDAPAFRESLLKFIGDRRPQALALGSGGASKAVCYALKELRIRYTIVSRTPKPGALSYTEVTKEIIAQNPLIINTTPLGTLIPGVPCIPYEGLTPDHFLFDLGYNPDPTGFLRAGSARGAHTLGGMDMLAGQAEMSWEIWNSRNTAQFPRSK